MSFEARLKELNITLPEPTRPAGKYVPAVQSGNLLFVSGQTSTIGGKPIAQGKLGREISIEVGQEAARVAVLNCLAAVRDVVGTLDKVTRVVKLNGSIASSAEFNSQPLVMNGASELIYEIFGEAGLHARAAIGVAELPWNVPVEIEMIVEVQA